MSNFRTNFKIKAIETQEYAMADGTKHKMKILDLVRMRKDPFTGGYLPAMKNASAKARVFPFRLVNGEYVNDEIYTNVELYKAAGASTPFALKTLDTSDFNFPSDPEGSEPRKSLNVSVFVDDESESDEQIENNLIKQGLYQLRGLGVTILDEFGSVQMYTDANKDLLPAISTTTAQQADRVKAAQERRAKQLDILKAIKAKNDEAAKDSKPEETKTESSELRTFDEEAETATFIAANPKAKAKEIAAHLAQIEAEIEAHNAKIGAVEGAK
jgi:hypothetical protein